MADKENIVPRLTRAAAKRAAASASAAESQPPNQSPAKKKRVALSELPTLSNAVVRPPPDLNAAPSKPTLRSEKEEDVEISPANLAAAAAVDVDSEVKDPQMCEQYDEDIYKYLRSMEVEQKRRPLANYIEMIQTDITANMRGALVDWLVEVAEEYKLVSDTLYLTVLYIDRFLSFNALSMQKLQLLGVSSMLVASKYEEISTPRMEDFCYITDNTYTKQEVVKMERDILKCLEFELGNPTIKTFLRQFTRAGQEEGKYPALQLEFLSSYLAELSLLDYGCVRFLPSVVAASAVFVARLTINPKCHPWNKTLQRYTGYRPSELKECIHAIHVLQCKESSLVSIREKYNQHRFKCVSTLLPPSEIPASYFEDLEQLFSQGELDV